MEFEEKLKVVKAERLALRKQQRKEKRKAEAAAAKKAEEERLSKFIHLLCFLVNSLIC